jgi:hypothetical protein
MKDTRQRMQRVLCGGLLMGGLLLMSAPAQATWYWTHGNSGHIEDMSVVENAGACTMGWGVDIQMTPGTTNWVHFAIPSMGDANKGARYIKLNYENESIDGWINQVDVYNGATMVGSFPYSPLDAGTRVITLDLGSIKSFNRGLGISVGISAGVEGGMAHHINFYGAGANFVFKP